MFVRLTFLEGSRITISSSSEDTKPKLLNLDGFMIFLPDLELDMMLISGSERTNKVEILNFQKLCEFHTFTIFLALILGQTQPSDLDERGRGLGNPNNTQFSQQ